MRKKSIHGEDIKVDMTGVDQEDIMLSGCEEEGTDYNAQVDQRIQQVCGAWKTADEAASGVWHSVHSELLKGDLVFAFKSTSPGSNIQQLVVVKFLDKFSVGVIYSGYTMLLPKVPYEYLTTTLLDDLKKNKPGEDVIKAYNYILDQYGK